MTIYTRCDLYILTFIYIQAPGIGDSERKKSVNRKVINRVSQATPPDSNYIILQRNVYLKCERCLKKK